MRRVLARLHSTKLSTCWRDTAAIVGKILDLSGFAHTLGCMRRTIAMFMLLLFGAFLCVPLFAASYDSQNELPACCKRNGKHRCMSRMMQVAPGTTQVSAPPEKCPLFPQTRMMIVVQDHAVAPSPSGAYYAALQSHPACHSQLEAQKRISFDRSRQKRGPPAANS
jgi:hypothetical protein